MAENTSQDGGLEAAGEEDEQEMVEETLFIGPEAPPREEWYHGRLSRTVAEERLNKCGLVGSYLIREREKNIGSYALSYLGKNGCSHFQITALCGDYYIGGRRFENLGLLVGYYISCSYLLKGEQLCHPVSPPEPVNDNRRVIAMYPFSKMPDTDELSFSKGDIFEVLNEMGGGWLWVRSTKDWVEGQVLEVLMEDLPETGTFNLDETVPYFHPNITIEEAAAKLRGVGSGSYLVRPSENFKGDYSLCVLCDKMVQRFRIKKENGMLTLGGRTFNGLDAIIDRYKKEEIYDNYKLCTPVCRQKHTVMQEELEKLSKRGSQEQLSDSLRANSKGPRIGLAQDQQGFLQIKKGQIQKGKKWKKMFFILISQTKQLVFIENEKRSKPKGLIELSCSNFYPVHDSFFGRPYCFQLIMSSDTNHFQIFYLCAENNDICQTWIKELKAYCVNTKQIVYPSRSLKELRTLTVEVCDARQLPTKLVPHPYCVVSINKVKVCRTQMVDPCNNNNAVWEEKFILDDIPFDVKDFSISLFNQTKRKDPEIAHVTLSLSEVHDTNCYDKWHQLAGGEYGSLRIRARYLHEIIMPEDNYTTLKDLILYGDLNNLLELFSLSGNDRIPLAKALLQIFRHEKLEKVILKTMNDIEIAKEEEVSTLFRATSLATTLMDQYMKLTASFFVSNAIQECVSKIVESKNSCELNPTCLESGADLEANKELFLENLHHIMETITKARGSCPIVLRYICGCLQKSVAARWPGDENVRTRVVSGFIFLRLLCPAIINPKSFNLISETPSDMAQRTLKLLAKALQNLANLVEFGAKESFMESINPFIRRNKDKMIVFLDELSDVSESETSRLQESQPCIDDVARDLATIHQICAAHLDELRKNSATKGSLKQLVVVTEILTDHKKRFMT